MITDPDAARAASNLLLNAISNSGDEPLSEPDANLALAMVSALDPQNELEAALASQLVATHFNTMHLLAQSRRAARISGRSRSLPDTTWISTSPSPCFRPDWERR